jgi:hypothetical protein
MIYCIQATVTTKGKDGWNSCKTIPTFYLDSRVQGIVDETHAERIVKDILNPFNDDSIVINMTIYTIAKREMI